jgi:hypothetical protein
MSAIFDAIMCSNGLDVTPFIGPGFVLDDIEAAVSKGKLKPYSAIDTGYMPIAYL